MPTPPTPISRRRFLRGLAASGIALPALPGLARADAGGGPPAPRHLVLVELQGGNDGLNTVVPRRDPAYRRLRPTLALDADATLALDDRLGLHPALGPLARLWKRGDLAIVQGVGYPAPNRSHFRSIEIWETASDAEETRLDGWLAPLTAALPGRGADGIKAVALADDAGPLAGTVDSSIVLEDMERFVRQARRLAERDLPTRNPTLAHVLAVERTTRQAALEFSRRLEASLADAGAAPERVQGPPLVRRLDAVARLIAEDVGPQVWKVGLGGFDTHVNQLGRHDKLMRELGAGIARFERVLEEAGRWNDVALVTYSEFGRRAGENAGGGTDHGTAAPHFVLGGAVRGGLHGAGADLDRLDAGDLAHTTDFRSLYRTLATDWFGQRVGDAPYAGYERLRLFG